MKLHADYVKAQMQALAEQARDLAQHAAKAATPARQRLNRRLPGRVTSGPIRAAFLRLFCAMQYLYCNAI